MKSLRQLLRRRLHSNSVERAPKRRATKRQSGDMNRRLSSQTLEQRQLLAGDLEIAHNYWNGFDVNQDLQISPSDALGVINYLATSNAQGEQPDGGQLDDFAGKKVDVNADGSITPSDALSVINALARGEQMDPLVEYFLNARDADDNLLPKTNGVIEVDTGIDNSFFLEVSYSDLRTFGDDLGAFSIFPDIGVNQESLLRPVLRETQQVIINEAIRQSSSGSLTVGQAGTTDTAVITLGQIQGGFAGALSDALINTFGFSAGEFEISEPTALQGESGDDLGFEIKYVADSFGNMDIADLTFTPNFNNNVPVEFREFAPFEADGTTPNTEAVRFNLDTVSRTLNDGQEFYNLLNRGTYSLADGFSNIGGVGGAFPRGIRDVDDNGMLIEPFDAFRIEVFISSPLASPLIVDVNPGEGVDPLTLYGSNDVVEPDLITLGPGSRVTFSTGEVANTPPVLNTTPLTSEVSEDDGTTIVDLLTGATDVDNDTLSVSGFSVQSGDASGIAQNGNDLTITPSTYNALKVGETVDIVATYNVGDGNGGSVEQTLNITINGANDTPIVTAAIVESVSENTLPFNIDLLQNASDPDGDTLNAINIVQNGNADPSGITVDDTNNRLLVDPSAYAALETGESVTVVYDYTVSDGNGGNVASTVTITINGDTPNIPPTVSAPVTVSLSEDDSNATLNLLDNASDDDGDSLSVSGLTLASGDAGGITENGNTLSISPAAYNALAGGDTETIVYNYNVIDGEGGSVAQTATITIGGANDAPTVGAAITASFSEDDAGSNVDLLTGASDPDTGDTISVDNLTRVSGDDSGISQTGDSLTVDPSAYNGLAVSESEVITYTYDVIDGNGGVTPQSATITITGANDAPTVGDAVTATFSEDDSSASVDMIEGAVDADTNDTLTVTNIVTVSGDSTPFMLENGNSLTFAPSFYNGLGAGESEIVVLTYDVIDGNGGSAAQSATITINGVNDAPTVGDPLTFTYNEDQAVQTASLLDGASDPDTNDSLNVIGVVSSGDVSGISRIDDVLTITPSAYSSLNTGQSAVITFTYQVTDGTTPVNQTATVTIEGRDEGIPTVSGPIEVSFNEDDASGTVDLLAGASDPDQDPISVINAVVTSGDASGVAIDAANNQLLITPSAYNALNTGQSEVVVVSYDITDDQGNTVAQTATVTIVGEDEPLITPSSISGQLYIDHIENVDAVIRGAEPVRNGEKDSDEQALGGVTVNLLRTTSTGEVKVDSLVTDNNGSYKFSDVDPGTYFVEYEIAESVQFTGSKRGLVVVESEGGKTKSGPQLHAFGLVGVLQRLDFLVKTYIAAGIFDTLDLSEGLAGGSAQLNADGSQQMFVAGEGFEAKFAEIVLNDARDSALLTIIDANDKVLSAHLTLDEFVVTGDGLGVRFFGEVEDLDFKETIDAATLNEFDDYRNAIDSYFANDN